MGGPRRPPKLMSDPHSERGEGRTRSRCWLGCLSLPSLTGSPFRDCFLYHCVWGGVISPLVTCPFIFKHAAYKDTTTSKARVKSSNKNHESYPPTGTLSLTNQIFTRGSGITWTVFTQGVTLVLPPPVWTAVPS